MQVNWSPLQIQTGTFKFQEHLIMFWVQQGALTTTTASTIAPMEVSSLWPGKVKNSLQAQISVKHSMYVSDPMATRDIWCIPISTDRLQKSCPNQGFLVLSHPVNFGNYHIFLKPSLSNIHDNLIFSVCTCWHEFTWYKSPSLCEGRIISFWYKSSICITAKKWPLKFDCVVLLQEMADIKEQNFHVSNWAKLQQTLLRCWNFLLERELWAELKAFCWLWNVKSGVTSDELRWTFRMSVDE